MQRGKNLFIGAGRIFTAGGGHSDIVSFWVLGIIGGAVLGGVKPIPNRQKMFEFFRLETVYSSAAVIHNACNSRTLSVQTEQISGAPASPRTLSGYAYESTPEQLRNIQSEHYRLDTQWNFRNLSKYCLQQPTVSDPYSH